MSIVEIRTGGRFKLKERIGSGSFGDIYIAQNVQTGEEFAVKFEESKTKYPQLIYEAKIINTLQGTVGIPNLIWCGQEGDFNILIMELLGDDIESLFNLCNRRLSLKTLLILVDQILTLIEYIHGKGFLHRDLKPENILMGFGKNSHLAHIIDYGLSKRYRDPKTGKHIPYREGKYLTGTARYASINTHQGKEQGRRDDIEALGYIFVYLFKGSLPWQGLPAASKQTKYEMIMQKKMDTPLNVLCSDMPEEFQKFLEYARGLKFEEKPDYQYLKRIFKELFLRKGFEYDFVYDWLLIPLSQRMNIDINQKVTVDLEFSIHDNVVNQNLYSLHDYVVKTPKEKEKMAANGVPNQGDNEDDLSNGDEKNPNKKKAGNPEYLRTELKSAERGPKIHSPKKSIQQFPPEKPKAVEANKKQGKDCNIF